MPETAERTRRPAAENGSLNDENMTLLHRYHDAAPDDAKTRAAALSTLTERNMGLVRTVAARYRDRLSSSPGTEFEDLVEVGVIGMLKAVRSFDFSYETTFSTYAVPLIIGEIRRHLRDDGTVRVSRDIRRRSYLLLQKKEELLRVLGREPTVRELSAAAGVEESELVFLLDEASPVHSLSEPVSGGDGDSFTLENVLCEEENGIDRLTERLSLSEAVSRLPEFERRILALRYRGRLSQQQTAAVLGVTQVKISRTEKKIFAILRKELQPSG